MPAPLFATRAPVEQRIAVLPFVSAGPEIDRRVSSELYHEVLRQLAKHWSLRVVPRETVEEHRAVNGGDLRTIARDLKATHVLEGRIELAEIEARVVVRVLDAATLTSVLATGATLRIAVERENAIDDAAHRIAEAVASALHRRAGQTTEGP